MSRSARTRPRSGSPSRRRNAPHWWRRGRTCSSSRASRSCASTGLRRGWMRSTRTRCASWCWTRGGWSCRSGSPKRCSARQPRATSRVGPGSNHALGPVGLARSRTARFVEDVDVQPAAGVRVVQLTPAGSACSIGVGTGLTAYDETAPGTIKGLHLVVADIEQARAELLGRGVEVGPAENVGGGVKYARLADPDDNTLTLQEMAWRT